MEYAAIANLKEILAIFKQNKPKESLQKVSL